MIWLVWTYKDKRFMGIAISWAFTTREAAMLWIETKADKESGFTYEPANMPLYDLTTVKSFVD